MCSNQTGAYVEYAFAGTGIRFLTKTGPAAGIFDIYLDGSNVATFDSYAISNTFSDVAYENLYLSDGSHTIKIVATGTKNANSSAYNCCLDYIEYK